MRSSSAGLAALAALAVCLAALLAAVTGEVEIGLVSENASGRVGEVVPGSPAWAAGIRPGQAVVAIHPSSDPGGWAITTTDGTTQYSLRAAGANAALRLSGLAAVGGILLALVALLVARRSPRGAQALSADAVVLGAIPALALDAGLASWIALAAGAAAPALWLARWKPMGRAAGAVLVGAGALAGVLGIVGVQGTGDQGAHWLLVPWAVVACTGALGVALDGARVTPERVAETVSSVTLLDLGVAGLVALAVGSLGAAGVPVPWLLALALLGSLAYARSRRGLRAALDRVLLADLRERAAMRATEEERSRMAREIHDDPLQAIAGVIRQLEGDEPDTGQARDALRDVASRLRTVATELHPPVLDDLGLVPAIETVARTAGGDPAPRIVVDVDDRTGYAGAERPPADVELAVFRIVQEAVGNAVHHAQGTWVSVAGSVGAHLVEITVTDDGTGFSEARTEAALRQGRIGLASMRQRAAAIGARLEVGRRPEGGTRVAVRWEP